MTSTSRRRFLGVAGAGAAAATATVVAAPALASPGTTRLAASSATEPVVAYVEDPASGDVRLHVGEREVVVHDPDLAHRLLNAAGR